MSHFFVNAQIWLGEFDISGDLNMVSIQRSQAPLGNDTFGDSKTCYARIAGLSDGVFGLAGLVELTDDGQDEIFNANMSLSNKPILVTLKRAVDFDRCKFGVIQQGQYQSGGTVGNRAEFSADGRISNHALTDGNIMAIGAKTGTFNRTWRELGAVSATQKIRAQIHATAKTAFTSAVFKVQSADDGAGTNATDRITFSTITGFTSEHPTPVSGAISQTFWRVICSAFTGTSLTMVSAVGIH